MLPAHDAAPDDAASVAHARDGRRDPDALAFDPDDGADDLLYDVTLAPVPAARMRRRRRSTRQDQGCDDRRESRDAREVS